MRKSKFLIFLLILLPLIAMKCHQSESLSKNIETEYLTDDDYEKMRLMTLAESERYRKEKEAAHFAGENTDSIDREGEVDKKEPSKRKMNTAKILALTRAMSEHTQGNYQEAYQLFKNLLPDANAQFYLARMYLYGDGVEEDVGIAYQYLRQAVAQDHTGAMYLLGLCYSEGLTMTEEKISTEESQKRSLHWIEKAAEKDYEEAVYTMGSIYENGFFTEKDLLKARAWFQKGVDIGHAESMLKLGGFYLEGNGVEKDTDKGISLLEQAAKSGSTKAALNLGLYYYFGTNSKNGEGYNRAKPWLEMAAQADDTRAMLFLGMIYKDGKGGRIDVNKAQKWFQKAQDLGDLRAEKHLEELKK